MTVASLSCATPHHTPALPTQARPDLDDHPWVAGSRRGADRRSRRAHFSTMFGHLGGDMARTFEVHTREDCTATTWPEALAWLRDGITVTHACHAAVEGRWPKHRIRLNPDGTSTLHAHGEVDLHSEAVMAALGAFVPTCVRTAATLTGAGTVGEQPWGGSVSARRITSLHAAVAWAQRPHVDWQAVGPLLHVLTPTTWDLWQERGWTLAEATPFLLAGADRTIAEQWRETGQMTKAAARLAARGEVPDGDHVWAAAGFTRAQSLRWRTGAARGGEYSPASARRLQDAGFSPSMWRDLRDFGRFMGAGTPQPSEEDLLIWAEAGVPAAHVTSWWSITGGDLSVAAQWAPTGIHTYCWVELIQRSPAQSPVEWTPQQVAAWISAGISAHDYLGLDLALRSGVEPQVYQQVVAADPRAQSWRWTVASRLAHTRALTS